MARDIGAIEFFLLFEPSKSSKLFTIDTTRQKYTRKWDKSKAKFRWIDFPSNRDTV